MQKWVATNGFQEKSTGGSRSKSKQPVADLGSMAKDKAVNLLYRFFDWYVVKKRPGDPSVNGRQVGQLRCFLESSSKQKTSTSNCRTCTT